MKTIIIQADNGMFLDSRMNLTSSRAEAAEHYEMQFPFIVAECGWKALHAFTAIYV